MNKFTILRLGSRKTERLITDTHIHDTGHSGKILGLHITPQDYYNHIKNIVGYASRTLTALYRFKQMPTKIKLHLVKTRILPILDYPSIPTHTLSNAQLSKLQKVQNRALRFAANQRHPYTMDTEQIHTATKTLPLNIRLHLRAEKIWDRILTLNIPTLTSLQEQREHINRYHYNFRSSLDGNTSYPTPLFH